MRSDPFTRKKFFKKRSSQIHDLFSERLISGVEPFGCSLYTLRESTQIPKKLLKEYMAYWVKAGYYELFGLHTDFYILTDYGKTKVKP